MGSLEWSEANRRMELNIKYNKQGDRYLEILETDPQGKIGSLDWFRDDLRDRVSSKGRGVAFNNKMNCT